MQAAPLSVKVTMTQERIREWVREYGVDGVYVSFSGGKDSTVLLTIAREMYPDIPAVFVDTGLEFPEIREFVRTWDNVEWVKPKMTFRQVIEKYGYPFISKEVSERVYFAQKYLMLWRSQRESMTSVQTIAPTMYSLQKFLGLNKTENIPDNYIEILQSVDGAGSLRIKQLLANSKDRQGRDSKFGYRKYVYLAAAPFPISNHCCAVMKKRPAHSYQKRTGRNPITAQMASESKLRTQKWLQSGCNGFDLKAPMSNPMAFWTEQDVLLYIYEHQIPIAKVYGNVVKDNEIDGQLDWDDLGIFDIGIPVLRTTGADRTGCAFCAFGLHLEKSPNRLERMSETHPKLFDFVMRGYGWDDRGMWMPKDGLGYWFIISWINIHGDMDIRVPSLEEYRQKYSDERTEELLRKDKG